MSDTPLLQLPLLEASQAQKHVTHNEALLLLDAAIQLSVLSRGLAAPPASPADGDRYLVAAGGSGAWLAHDGEVALREAGSWRFLAPKAGWRLWDQAASKFLIFDGSAWNDIQDIDVLDGVALLGVNATADAGNRLTVASPAVLFTHEGGDQRVKINKHLTSGTGSLLFQADYSGRAEIGLAGDDDFHVKVSADGSTWHEAITVDRATGGVTFPNTAADPIGNDRLLAGDDLTNAVANGHFERGDFGWTKGAGWTIESDAANARSGAWLARNGSGAVSNSTLQNNGYSAAIAGDVIQASAWFKASGTAGLNMRVQIVWHDASKAVLSTSNGNAFTADQASHVQSLASAAAPAGTAFYRVRAICTKTAGTVWVDTIAASRLRDAASMLSAATVGTSLLGGDITAAGKALLDDASAAAQRTTLGLGTAAIENTSAFAAAAHSHSGLAPAGGTAGQILKKNSSSDYDYSWGGDDGGEWYSAALAADVALAVSNTWYDGPAVTLPAGTWLVSGHITHVRNTTTAEHVYARMTDDTVHYASTQQYHASVTGTGVSLTLTAIVTVAATTTVKLQASTSAGIASSLMKAALTANASGNNATQITAIRLA